MNFPDAFFTHGLSFTGFVLLGFASLAAILSAPWQRLRDEEQLHVWAGTIVTLMLIWSLKAGVKPGLNLHMLGATAYTLMFGWQLALLGLMVVLSAVTLNGAAGWESFGINGVLMAVVPVGAAGLLGRWVTRRLPANFFVYVFVGAFFSAAAVALLVGLLATLLLSIVGIYPAEELFSEYLPYFMLLGFSEAWLNGAIVTLMAVYCPHWLASFDVDRYFPKKNR